MKSNERIIGDIGPESAHTLIVCFAGIHGNEVGGVIALEKIFETLARKEEKLKGRFIGVRGNVKALKGGKRYIEEDLNRLWSDEIIHIARNHQHDHPEFEELAALCDVIDSINLDNYRQKIFIDLHGTSAANGIFAIVKDYKESAFIVDELYSPVLLKLHDSLHNTTVPYMAEHGFIALGFEGGKIGSKETIENHRLTMWQILLQTALIEKHQIPEEVLNYQVLSDFASQLPKYLKLDYCHKIKASDRFEMMPGFKNYDRIKKDDLLAKDQHGEIRSQYDGYILMPLYQKEGSDGFFIISEADMQEPSLNI